MRERNRSIVRVLFVLVSCGLAGALTPAVRADFDRSVRIDAETVVIRNLIGQIEIVGHGGSDFEIDVRVQGGDATPERVKIRTDEGRRAEVTIQFPLDESKRYIYPRLENGNVSFSLGDDESGWLERLFGSLGGSVKVSGRGSGLEIWADVTVRVPRGALLVIDHGVGALVARDVIGDLELSSHAGHVVVTGTDGAVSVDTGSGHVTVAHARGELHLDTGSGHVSLDDVQSGSVHVDTGSGRVDLSDVDTSKLHVDTGSGHVEASAVSADDLSIDTGSGSVTLELARMGHGEFSIDTGSGSLDLRLPPDASAEIRADTGAGGIRLDLTGDYRILHEEEDEIEFTIGSGAANVELDTGSGTIRVSQ